MTSYTDGFNAGLDAVEAEIEEHGDSLTWSLLRAKIKELKKLPDAQ